MKDTYLQIELSKIQIKPSRYRKDLGDIPSLAESIKTVGQLVPIIITENYELIAGERRFRAHQHNNAETINAIIRTTTEIDNSIIEILENLERKDFTWQEQVLAMDDLHKMMLSVGGKKWSERNTAEKVGLSSGNFTTDLNLAEALKEVPDIFEGCKNRHQALKALKKYQIDEAMAELSLRQSKTNYGSKARHIVFHGDCLELIQKLPDNHINALISDPIYGIDVFKQRFVNRNAAPIDEYNDKTNYFIETLEKLISFASQKMKQDSSVFMFCAFQNAQWLIDKWTAQGFCMDVIPGIWVRGTNTARTNAPTKYFNRCYDMFIYGTRGNNTLTKQGTTNVLQYQNILQNDRDHQAQKPVEMLEEIISRICLPGYVVLDPMCGTGSTLVAALKKGCIPIGFEIIEKYYNIAIKNIIDTLNAKDAGKLNI